jgi:hypothetical protein
MLRNAGLQLMKACMFVSEGRSRILLGAWVATLSRHCCEDADASSMLG